jgi:predicted secreted protein
MGVYIMKDLAEDIIDDLECDIITARQAQQNLEKIKNEISSSDYRDVVSFISDYIAEEIHNREPEVDEMILEGVEVSHYDWDEEKECDDAWNQNYLLEE